jgi:hypothetical protein
MKLSVSAISLILLSVFLSCGKKEDEKITSGDTIGYLIKKDSTTGKEKVHLRYIVKKGDKFFYKMTAKTSTVENSPATEGKDQKQDNEINYYYNKEVQDIDERGIISYKVKYDSIVISSQMDDRSINYNSNIDDSVKNNPAFIQYNAVVNEPFYLRVSPEGEITDVYGLEKIYENLFRELGDTLKDADKQTVKESFGDESIKEVMQQEYQTFPRNEIFVDSSWVKSYTTSILFFDITNDAKYTLKGIEDKDGKKIVNIEAQLVVEFLSKEARQRGIRFKIENAETGGQGKIAFNLNRGCIVSKETSTNLRLDLSMSAQGQSAKSKQSVTTNLVVTLLN